MRYSPLNYARALSEIIGKKGDEKASIHKFLSVVKKNGDEKMLPKIFDAFKKIEIKKHGGSHVKIEFAREMPEEKIKSIIKNFGTKDWVETSLNPSLVAGIRITIDGERELDNSISRKLHKMFK